MRIGTPHKKRRGLFPWRMVVIFIIAVLAYFGYDEITSAFREDSDKMRYICDAENFKNDKFVTSNATFTTNCTQSREAAYEGRYSCLCEGQMIYGPTLKLPSLGQNAEVGIALYYMTVGGGSGRVVLSSDQGDYLHVDLEDSGDQWQTIEHSFVLPEDAVGNVWKIYPHLIQGKGKIYFDNFEVTIKDSSVKSAETFPKIELQINAANFKTISRKRDEAREVGLLFSSRDDLVNANVRIDDNEYSCLTRLKGDLLDHLAGDKWSFRIELNGSAQWNKMKKFSIHNSKARSHLAEWVMHKMMRREDIMTPQYDFASFVLNGRSVGIYGYEQHFDNYFLQENERVVAPIIRHNDDGYWNNVLGELKEYEWAESSSIELFNKENDGDTDFMELYHYGHSALNDYLNGRKSAAQVFDVDKMARYYALIEIGHGLHAQLLTNIRFYVHPTTGLLEPIGYDFYGDHMPNVNEDWRPVGMWEDGNNIVQKSRDGYGYMRRLFGDLDFFTKYMFYLERYVNPVYLQTIHGELKEKISNRVSFINTDADYKGYTYDLFHHFRKAKFTRAKLYPISDVSLRTFRSKDAQEVAMQSFHYFPIEIVGYSTNSGEVKLDKPLYLNAYSPDSPTKMQYINTKAKAKSIMYKTIGTDSIFNKKINNDSAPIINVKSPSSELNNIIELDGVTAVDQEVLVITKQLTINNPVSVNAAQRLTIPQGTEIILGPNGSLSVQGELIAIGAPSEPIVIRGTSRRGQSILIHNNGSATFTHCSFLNLSSYKVGAISLPAAVNVDQANAKITDCQWKKNNSEVDLRVSGSDFMLQNCEFSDSSGDGIHILYSQGNISNLKGSNYGGIFLSQTSGRLEVKNLKVTNILGWAIDINQYAEAGLENVTFDNSSHSVRVGTHSNVAITGYNGKANKRDIEVTESIDPESRLVINKMGKDVDVEFMNEPGTLLMINGRKKNVR